ncbi:hypothetical protein GPA10_26185 [Streptomyces sp. p1417]|uniref:Uncharacterized protein n=1 Tax=Streptomyces typhae TaxID=2681492 RepID=A0A6L6X2Y6_9ACTN|nr:hypothetical protein [Streptomyces typhae]
MGEAKAPSARCDVRVAAYRNPRPVAVALFLPRLTLRVLRTGADALLRELISAVVDRIDLDAVVLRVDIDRVADRVDVNRIVDRVDIDGIADRVDVDRVADRVDVDRVADRVDVDRVAERVDVDRVADRVDVDRVADRVDVHAVVARVDLVPLTLEVLTRIDLGRIVRDTGGSMTKETLDAFRERSMRADRMVNHVADRLLRRSGTVRADGEDGAGPLPGNPP